MIYISLFYKQQQIMKILLIFFMMFSSSFSHSPYEIRVINYKKSNIKLSFLNEDGNCIQTVFLQSMQGTSISRNDADKVYIVIEKIRSEQYNCIHEVLQTKYTQTTGFNKKIVVDGNVYEHYHLDIVDEICPAL